MLNALKIKIMMVIIIIMIIIIIIIIIIKDNVFHGTDNELLKKCTKYGKKLVA